MALTIVVRNVLEQLLEFHLAPLLCSHQRFSIVFSVHRVRTKQKFGIKLLSLADSTSQYFGGRRDFAEKVFANSFAFSFGSNTHLVPTFNGGMVELLDFVLRSSRFNLHHFLDSPADISEMVLHKFAWCTRHGDGYTFEK